MRRVARYVRGDEVFEVRQEDKILHLVERGTPSQRKFVSAEHAAVQLAKLIDKKLAEGFAEQAPPPPPAAEAWPDPDDLAALQVHADKLMAEGDPRGQLIAFQLAAAQSETSDEERTKLLRRAVRLVDEHPQAFFGPLAEVASAVLPGDEKKASTGLVAELRGGSIARARLSATSRVAIDELYRGLRALPMARALGALSVGPSVKRSLAREGFHYQALYDAAIAEGLPPRLKELHLGDVPERFGQNLNLGDPSPLLAPGLERLTLHGRTLSLPELRLPELCALDLHAHVTLSLMRNLTRSALPRLEELRLASTDCDQVGVMDAFTQLEAFAPHLRRLTLIDFHLAPESLEALFEGRLLASLKELDLSQNGLGEDRVELLLERADRFAHLDRLGLERNLLPPTLVRQLRAAIPNVKCLDQSRPLADDRYDEIRE